MSLIEIGFPVLLLCLMYVFRSQTEKKAIPETSYIGDIKK